MIIIVRGLPGAGKSTYVRCLEADIVVAADDFMVDGEGKYQFDPSRLKHCHEQCQAVARAGHVAGKTVAVANTFTQEWEVAPYRTIDPTLRVVDLFDGGMDDAELAACNVHGVPESTIAAMRARWEPRIVGAWDSADPAVNRRKARRCWDSWEKAQQEELQLLQESAAAVRAQLERIEARIRATKEALKW